MKANLEIIVSRMAYENNITKREAREAIEMLSSTVEHLIEDGCTSFKFPLFTLSFKQTKAVKTPNIATHSYDVRTKICSSVKMSKRIKDKLREAFNVPPKIL